MVGRDNSSLDAMSQFNRVSHFEIQADEPERCAKFYQEVFGWKITKWEGGQMPYWMVETGGRDEAGGINGGILPRPCPAPPAMTSMSHVSFGKFVAKSYT